MATSSTTHTRFDEIYDPVAMRQVRARRHDALFKSITLHVHDTGTERRRSSKGGSIPASMMGYLDTFPCHDNRVYQLEDLCWTSGSVSFLACARLRESPSPVPSILRTVPAFETRAKYKAMISHLEKDYTNKGMQPPVLRKVTRSAAEGGQIHRESIAWPKLLDWSRLPAAMLRARYDYWTNAVCLKGLQQLKRGILHAILHPSRVGILEHRTPLVDEDKAVSQTTLTRAFSYPFTNDMEVRVDRDPLGRPSMRPERRKNKFYAYTVQGSYLLIGAGEEGNPDHGLKNPWIEPAFDTQAKYKAMMKDFKDEVQARGGQVHATRKLTRSSDPAGRIHRERISWPRLLDWNHIPSWSVPLRKPVAGKFDLLLIPES
ncbi:Hypothetical predicted protein [Lecanosticta acicola]|uniref:Uncharacterized protein n=1 Tax=Lecanosticta acicola TaxID=111012 RepID=A0AAI8Z8X3_9PEZI|nr:Hypothetical predicted protein [Lecanosticta acicola]